MSTNRVKTGIFSLTAAAPADDDGGYLRWHLLDHMPERYQLPGIVHGPRWIADGDYPGHRLAADGPLGQVGNAVDYLVGDPVERTFGSSAGWTHLPTGWSTDHQYITVVYLDGDPLTTTGALAAHVKERWRSGAVRPVFAGPLRSMVSWEARP
ncbi:hypothetical protein [Mycobacterium sp. 050134]|uniref:hypothetical protein n=1 Tax=Mycobacterium sp. 050134 TaxID=3096111 RepID=UPI002EDBA764